MQVKNHYCLHKVYSPPTEGNRDQILPKPLLQENKNDDASRW